MKKLLLTLALAFCTTATFAAGTPGKGGGVDVNDPTKINGRAKTPAELALDDKKAEQAHAALSTVEAEKVSSYGLDLATAGLPQSISPATRGTVGKALAGLAPYRLSADHLKDLLTGLNAKDKAGKPVPSFARSAAKFIIAAAAKGEGLRELAAFLKRELSSKNWSAEGQAKAMKAMDIALNAYENQNEPMDQALKIGLRESGFSDADIALIMCACFGIGCPE